MNVITTAHQYPFYLLNCTVVRRWEKDPAYCDTVKQTPPYNHGTRLVDLIDLAVLDFLMSQSPEKSITLQHMWAYRQCNGGGGVTDLYVVR